MSIIKRRMELSAEFKALQQYSNAGMTAALSRQFLRHLPIVCSPHHVPQVMLPLYDILTKLRAVLTHAVNSALGGFDVRRFEAELKSSIEFAVASPAVLTSFRFADGAKLRNHSSSFETPLFDRNAYDHHLQPSDQPIDTFMTIMSSFPGGEFWREWYQGFLDGKPLDWELQRRVALIRDEEWKKGPEHISEKIEEIRAAYMQEQMEQAEIPADHDAAPTYFLSAGKPLQSVETHPSNADDEEDQLTLQEELQEKSASLLDACRQTNEFPHIQRSAQKYDSEINKPLDDIGLSRLWSSANSLHNAIRADDRADRTARDNDLLPPKLLAALNDLMETHGLFIMGFENARELEQKKRAYLDDPRDPARDKAAQELADALAQNGAGINTPDLEDLEEDTQTSHADDMSGTLAATSLNGRLWNMLRAAGVAARKTLKAGITGAGTTVLGHDFIQFLLGNETLVMTYLRLAQGKAAEWLPAILNAIRSALGS